jgi:hypothetical protein
MGGDFWYWGKRDDERKPDECPLCKAGFWKVRADRSAKVCPLCGADNYMNAKRCRACKGVCRGH